MIKFIKTLYADYIVPVCKELGSLIKYLLGIENKEKNINTAPTENDK